MFLEEHSATKLSLVLLQRLQCVYSVLPVNVAITIRFLSWSNLFCAYLISMYKRIILALKLCIASTRLIAAKGGRREGVLVVPPFVYIVRVVQVVQPVREESVVQIGCGEAKQSSELKTNQGNDIENKSKTKKWHLFWTRKTLRSMLLARVFFQKVVILLLRPRKELHQDRISLVYVSQTSTAVLVPT